EEITNDALDEEGEEYSTRNIAFSILGFLAHGGDRFKTDENQNGDAGLNDEVGESVWCDDRCSRTVVLKRFLFITIGFCGIDRFHSHRPAGIMQDVRFVFAIFLHNLVIAFVVFDRGTVFISLQHYVDWIAVWIKRPADRAFAMTGAVTDGDHGE